MSGFCFSLVFPSIRVLTGWMDFFSFHLWSEENSLNEEDIATTVIDEEMSIYLEYI